CTLWVDAGFTGVAAARVLPSKRVQPVFGSESLESLEALEALHGRDDVLLSLDQRAGRPMDPAGCWQRSDSWPSRVIAMRSDGVGAGGAPGLPTLADVQARAGKRELIGAGGVRNTEDLRAAQQAGASAWLVASALHDLAIPPQR